MGLYRFRMYPEKWVGPMERCIYKGRIENQGIGATILGKETFTHIGFRVRQMWPIMSVIWQFPNPKSNLCLRDSVFQNEKLMM